MHALLLNSERHTDFLTQCVQKYHLKTHVIVSASLSSPFLHLPQNKAAPFLFICPYCNKHGQDRINAETASKRNGARLLQSDALLEHREISYIMQPH